MPRTSQPYPEEFRQQILELMGVDRTPAELAKNIRPLPGFIGFGL
ncbi:MAG: hypothetical protein U5K99_07970 [Anaerolineales bacterium]|nr:hypothetical protein [Anaerolineales bacterium]